MTAYESYFYGDPLEACIIKQSQQANKERKRQEREKEILLEELKETEKLNQRPIITLKGYRCET